MAIYHLSVKPVSRGVGRSATAAAAYRSASQVADRTTGQVFDYTRKSGVEHAEIVLPTEAAKRDINWPREREQLWNVAEEAEKRKDARVAREYEVALPHELSQRERTELVREFSQEIANRFGVAVDFAIHKPHREGDERNHHAHVLTTTRRIEATGLGAKAEIEWADTDRAKRGLGPAKEEVAAIRERWATLTNEKLQEHGHESRVDHRSLKDQGIDREPTTHLGPAVSGMQRRGMDTEVGARIQAEAQARLERAAELGRLERESAAIGQSILVLDGDIRSALQARDAQQRAAAPDRTATHDRDAVRREARERWLEHRDKQAGEGRDTGQEKGADLTRDRSKGRDTPDDDFSL
jgi:ATP-dependent exoDNAse (exonuclease V) alpha subunit